MPFEKITPEFIEDLLKNWRKGSLSNQTVNLLKSWTTESNSLEQKRLSIRDHLYSLVYNKVPQPFKEALETNDPKLIFSSLRDQYQESLSDEQLYLLLYCRYLDTRRYSVNELATNIGLTSRTLRRHIVKGFERLSLEIKNDLNQRAKRAKENNTTTKQPKIHSHQLIGIDKPLRKLSGWVAQEGAPHVISIEGIGGVGKTALAQLLKEYFEKDDQFDECIWVSARQKEISLLGEITPIQDSISTLDDVIASLATLLGLTHLAGYSTEDKLKALQHLSHQKKLLIIVDNLETIEDVEQVVPELQTLASPSKIIITSRKSLSNYENTQTFLVPELSLQDSQMLIEKELHRRGINLPIEDETLTALYEVTGGIPLALKLASAQFGFYSAREIIEQFRMGKDNTQNMYTHIYRQAWLLLDDTAKKLLLTMLLVSPDGEESRWICEMGGFANEAFDAGLRQLKRLSLIEFSGTIEKPLHRIHRLTTTFLQTDILNLW